MHKGGKTWGQGAPQECNTALLGSGVQVECLQLGTSGCNIGSDWCDHVTL